MNPAMRCFNCGSREGLSDGPTIQRDHFHVEMHGNFSEYSNIPCYVKAQVDGGTCDVLLVQTPEGENYMFDLKKGWNKTRISVADYNEFLSNYAMECSDEIRVAFIDDAPCLLMSPSNRHGVPKERVQGGFDFTSSAAGVVRSEKVKATASITTRINECVSRRGLGLGALLVHSLTKSDIKNNCLHIPIQIVAVLGIASEGNAYLVMGLVSEDNKDAMYYTS